MDWVSLAKLVEVPAFVTCGDRFEYGDLGLGLEEGKTTAVAVLPFNECECSSKKRDLRLCI